MSPVTAFLYGQCFRHAFEPIECVCGTAAAYLRATTDRRRKIGYVGGWLGKDNLGDELLFSALTRLLPDAHLMPFRGGYVAGSVLKFLPQLRSGILAGGTLIAQKREWLDIARQFTAAGRDLWIFGSGVEDPKFWPGHTSIEDWKPVLKRTRAVAVRGPISAALLAAAGIAQVEVVGDPVLAFAQSEVAPAPATPTLGLNIGITDGRLWGDERHVAQQATCLAALARRAGWNVEWFVIWPNDLAVTRSAAAASGTSATIRTIYRDHGRYLQRARVLTAFVGMKLHATALAVCALTPSLMLEYRPKCRDFMQTLGQDQFTIRTDCFRGESAWETVRSWAEHRESVAQALAANVWAAQRLQQTAMRRIAQALVDNDS